MLFTADRRVVVDQGFDRTVESVHQAFLDVGFSVSPIEVGDLHQKSAPGGRLRYAALEATLPELGFVRSLSWREFPPILGRRILGLRGHWQLHVRHLVESAGTLPAAGLARTTAL